MPGFLTLAGWVFFTVIRVSVLSAITSLLARDSSLLLEEV